MSPRWKRDANHAEIAEIWDRYGWVVTDTSMLGSNGAPGFPDLVCVYNGFTLLVEVKAGSEKLTPAEEAFRERVGSPPYVICRDVDDAIAQADMWRERGHYGF